GGTVALFMSKPEFTGNVCGRPAHACGPGDFYDELVIHRATRDKLTSIGSGSPNLLLYSGPPGFFTIGDSLRLGRGSDGKLQLFGADKNGFMTRREQTTRGSNSWTAAVQSRTMGWQSAAAETDLNGRPELLGTTQTNTVYARAHAPTDADSWLNW